MGKTLIYSTTLVFLVGIVYVCGYSLALSKDESHMPNQGMINWYEIYRNLDSQEGKALATEQKDVESNMDGFKLESKEPTGHYITLQSNDEIQLEDKPILINTMGDQINLNNKIESNFTSKIKSGGDWKSMSMTVFCGTPGNKNTKAHQVIRALISAYPKNDWVVLVIQGGGWAYGYKGWDSLRKDNLCGPYDLLVFGRSRKYCSKSTDAAAKLLQHGALVDGKTPAQVRDLMIQRQGVYDLRYDFISVYQSLYGVGWYYYGYQQCVDAQVRNGYVSIWSGSATD